jgi:hypothetical protein
LLGESDNSCPERLDVAAYQGVCLCPVLLCQELRSSSPVRLRIFFSELTSVNCVRLLLPFPFSSFRPAQHRGLKPAPWRTALSSSKSPPGFGFPPTLPAQAPFDSTQTMSSGPSRKLSRWPGERTHSLFGCPTQGRERRIANVQERNQLNWFPRKTLK